MQIVVPHIAETLHLLADVNLYLLPDLVGNRHLVVHCWLEAEVTDKLAGECLWLVVWVTDVPCEAVGAEGQVEMYLHKLLSKSVGGATHAVEGPVDYNCCGRELVQMIVQVNLSINYVCNK